MTRHEALPATLPGGGTRNGMPGFHDYGVYRGKLPLAVELPYECQGGCDRRCAKPDEICAVCRKAFGIERGGH